MIKLSAGIAPTHKPMSISHRRQFCPIPRRNVSTLTSGNLSVAVTHVVLICALADTEHPLPSADRNCA